MTITVTDVNERPKVDSPIADQTMNVGDTTTVSLQGKFSDPDGDTLTYTASSDLTTVANVSVNSSHSTLTLTAVSAGEATITVTAADRAAGNSDRLTATDKFMVTVEAGIPGKPASLISVDMVGGRGIDLGWGRVDGAAGYEVDVVPSVNTDHIEIVGTHAKIRGLTPGTNYKFRVRACSPCANSVSPLYSAWSDFREHPNPAPAPTADGHQADHTAAYRIGTITSSPDSPDGVPDAATVITWAIAPAAADWNSVMTVEMPDKNLKICDASDSACAISNRDGWIVTIETRAANPAGEGGVLGKPCPAIGPT